MDFSQDFSLTSLLVFQNTLKKELIRSLHVYKLKDEKEKEVEREFLFSLDSPYVEMAANPLFRMVKIGVMQVVEGQLMGLWSCIFAFHAHHSPHFTHIPSLLSISRNPKLNSIPTLANDLQIILKLSSKTADKESKDFSFKEKCIKGIGNRCHSTKNLLVLDQDLNCLPNSVATSELLKGQQIDSKESGGEPRKKRRAAAEDIARIALEDLVKYFDLPIAEASRNLKVGLTVLKRKCREFGIPRWPHRKIKSLDSLIRNLQEEAERQKQENEDAAVAVAKRQRMLEMEKETIERKPFMEIQSETKRFRQDVFKRRHRARVLQNLSL
ncbi:protein RKD5 isoform X2 [Mercurialis annua]|uniref:protein RKD5 isoform X2 n=1 Tax=Mercurialis annua TaxID=3986 RepID=UPI00215EE5BB|nr:protein RKD5 isoform X2 [Mercurialis annua]